MNIIKVLAALSILGLLSMSISGCSNKKEEVGYHENGIIKYKVELLNSKPHGMFYTFYPDGILKSRSKWENGMKNGVQELYYKSGVLKERAIWKNDKVDGPTEEFYKNGQLKKMAIKKGDKIIGDITIFDQEGKPLETRIYNRQGEMIYAVTYDGHGKQDLAWAMPIFRDEDDTVLVGATYKTTVLFGYRMKGRLYMLVGPVDSLNELTDTLAIVKPTTEGKFVFTTKASVPGKHAFSVKFVHETDESDTLSVDGLSVKHPYFVKER